MAWSNHGPIMAQSWPKHAPIMAQSWPSHDRANNHNKQNNKTTHIKTPPKKQNQNENNKQHINKHKKGIMIVP
jgi:hypothetical protein